MAASHELERGDAVALYANYSRNDDGSGWLVSPSYGIAVSQNVGAYVEAGFGTGAQRGTTVGSGITWMVHPRMQLDASMLRGVSSKAADWESGFGVSVYFP